MNQLVFVNDNQVVTDSLKIAEVFGKEHRRVLQDVRDLDCSEHFRQHNFVQSSYLNTQNKELPLVLMNRKGFALLAFSYTGKEATKFKEAYIEQFEKMEEELRKPKVLTDHQQRIELLKLSLEHEEKFVEYDGRLSKLEDNVRIDSFEQNALQKQIKKRVYKVFETANPNGLDLKKLFPCIHRNFRDAFGVPTYRDLRKLDYEEAVSWVSTWRPLI